MWSDCKQKCLDSKVIHSPYLFDSTQAVLHTRVCTCLGTASQSFKTNEIKSNYTFVKYSVKTNTNAI